MSERTAKGPTSVHELSRAQQAAGRRAAESRATVPDVAWTVEADAPDEAWEGALLAAVAAALREHPRCNASYRDGTVVAHGRVNLAVTVDGADWSVAPVITDADERPAAALATTLEDLRAAAATGELTATAFAGATFTVSGLGAPGLRRLAVPVPPGQVATLGVGAPSDRAVVVDGKVVVRRRADLTLVADARAVQGDVGPGLLRAIAARLAAGPG